MNPIAKKFDEQVNIHASHNNLLTIYIYTCFSFAEVPQPPLDCSLYNESSALEVNCIPGSDGGLPQHFLLEVRGSVVGSELFQTSHTLQTPQSDQGEAGEVPPIYRTENPRPTFQLHDLEPGIEYTLAVYAINQRGKSEPRLIRNVRITEAVGTNLEQSGGTGFVINGLKSFIPTGETQNMMIIIIGVGKCLLIIFNNLLSSLTLRHYE